MHVRFPNLCLEIQKALRKHPSAKSQVGKWNRLPARAKQSGVLAGPGGSYEVARDEPHSHCEAQILSDTGRHRGTKIPLEMLQKEHFWLR